MSFDSFLDPVFGPVLSVPPFWGILLISLLVAVLMSFIYKWMTDQNLMKGLKEDIKKSQKEMKSVRDNPKRMMEIQKKAMDSNMKYMMHSMRPTLVTMIPLLLIFGWLSANLAYYPIMPGEVFNTSVSVAKDVVGSVDLVVPDGFVLLSNSSQEIIGGQASWVVMAPESLKSAGGDDYSFEYIIGGKSDFKGIIVSTRQDYAPVVETVKNSDIKVISVSNRPLKLMNLFGWRVGWLGSYIIFSIIFSMLLRKIMKLH